MLRVITVALSIGFALFLWQCTSDANAEEAAEKPSSNPAELRGSQPVMAYQTMIAMPANQSRVISITGRLQPIEELQLVSEVQGKALATTKLLNEGVRFRKGEVLVRLDETQYRLDLQAQKSQFQTALVRIMSRINLDYPKAHAQWDQYLRDFDETQVLRPLPEVTDDQMRFFLSANSIYSSYYSIKSAEELLPKYQLQAPFDGVVTRGSVVPGAVISPGIALATLSRTDALELRAAVSSADVDQFHAGKTIPLAYTNSGQIYSGKVDRIGGTVDPSTQSVPVFIRVSGKDLREGLFMESKLSGDVLENALAVPIRALHRNKEVYVIRDSMVVLQLVRPLSYEEQQVWVTGLERGEIVIVEAVDQPIVGTRAIPKN